MREGRCRRRIGGSGRRLAAIALAVAMTASPAAPAWAVDSPAKEFGLGTATVVANLIYGPTKLLYAVGGGLVAGIAYVFSGGDLEVARPIVDASLRGDYFVTTDHLRGREELEFIGRRPQHRRLEEGGPGDWGSGTRGSEAPDPGF